jgi:hypothetical protein
VEVILTSTHAAKVAALQPGEKCNVTFVSDWQPPKGTDERPSYPRVTMGFSPGAWHCRWNKWKAGGRLCIQRETLTPKYTLNTIYGVLEPWQKNPWQSNTDVVYSDEEATLAQGLPFIEENQNPAETMPQWAIRSHIIIHSQTPKIEDGVLVWDAVVERTENK